jgi:hypothetical protein
MIAHLAHTTTVAVDLAKSVFDVAATGRAASSVAKRQSQEDFSRFLVNLRPKPHRHGRPWLCFVAYEA